MLDLMTRVLQLGQMVFHSTYPIFFSADLRIPSDVGTVGGWPTVGTIPGGRVTPIGPTGTVTSVSGGLSSGSTSPTSDTSEGPSASATGPINEDTPNAGYVAPVTSPVHILLVLGGVGVWWRIEL